MVKLVNVTATKTATTTVRTDAGRVPYFTNADKDADAEAVEKRPGMPSAHSFQVTPEVAKQLKDAGVVTIDGEADDVNDALVARNASVAETLEANAQVDADENDVITGADTRDTTAFTGGTAQRGGTTKANPEVAKEADDVNADAPPAADADTEEKTPAPKRRAAKK